MQKIATCIAGVNPDVDLLDWAMQLCAKYDINIHHTRIGRSSTPTRGWFHCIFLVQPLQRVAEQIEMDCVKARVPVWHIQGEPTQGTVQQYTTAQAHAVYKYSDKPQGLGQIIEYNGNTIHVY